MAKWGEKILNPAFVAVEILYVVDGKNSTIEPDSSYYLIYNIKLASRNFL